MPILCEHCNRQAKFILVGQDPNYYEVACGPRPALYPLCKECAEGFRGEDLYRLEEL